MAFLSNLWNGISNGVGTVVNGLNNAVNWVSNGISQLFSPVTKPLEDFTDATLKPVNQILSGVPDMVNSVTGVSGLQQAQSQFDQTLALQKEEQAYQRDIDAQNQANIDREFNYQKYLNENQTQISARDAQLAGINPLAMKGNSVSSTGGTISSGSSAPIMDNRVAEAYGVQGSQLLALGNAMMSGAQTYKQRKSAENIAKMGDETTKLMASFSDALSIATLIKECISSGVDPSFIKDISANIGGFETHFDHKGVGKFNEDILKNKYLDELYDNNLKASELDEKDSVKKLLESLGLNDGSSSMLSGLVKLLLLKK